jgi:hypothetical protein
MKVPDHMDTFGAIKIGLQKTADAIKANNKGQDPQLIISVVGVRLISPSRS